MSQSDPIEKSNYDKAQDLLDKYAHPDAEVLPEKVVADIEALKAALQAERVNAAQAVESIYHMLGKLSADGKLKGRFVAGNEQEFDYYHLEAGEENPITLVLIPAAGGYEWKMEEGIQFSVEALPAFDVLHKDLTVLKKANLLPRLFNATQSDTRNPGAIQKLEELLLANDERKNKALVAEWRQTLEYILSDLKDEKTGKSVLVDQLFNYTKNGKTKSYKILKADRTGLVVMIDEELELDRKFQIDSYAYEMILAFMPMLKKYKGKSPAAKPAGRGGKSKQTVQSPETPAAGPSTEGEPAPANDPAGTP